MSHGVFERGKRAFFFLLTSASILLAGVSLEAQDDSTPKYDLFVGYQWLHPGATVANPLSSAANPTAMTLPDMPKGFGTSFTYNFSKYVGFESDLGTNWDSNETTVSGGPRFIFRTGDGSYFVHALVGYNRLDVNGLGSSNGIGGVIGGGTDFKITRMVSWRIFEADFVVAQHHQDRNGHRNDPPQVLEGLHRTFAGVAGYDDGMDAVGDRNSLDRHHIEMQIRKYLNLHALSPSR